jgi:hypothetical protein
MVGTPGIFVELTTALVLVEAGPSRVFNSGVENKMRAIPHTHVLDPFSRTRLVESLLRYGQNILKTHMITFPINQFKSP